VQLAAAIEERLGIATESGLLDHVHTVGELRRLVAASTQMVAGAPQIAAAVPLRTQSIVRPGFNTQFPAAPQHAASASLPSDAADVLRELEAQAAPASSQSSTYVYPHWPWSWPVRLVRAAFVEAVMRPLVWLLGKPRVVGAAPQHETEPMLIVANHVTTFDGPLLEYALPAALRHRMAVAMSGEMLEDYRHFRDADRLTVKARLYPPGPLIYVLLTALFNVFPLPRRRDFQRSFAHAGEALDRGMHVLLFPEGTRSEGALARFRLGIGLLVKQSSAPVLPMAIRGLGELKRAGRGWLRSGAVEVRVGEPMRFSPTESEAAITSQLHAAVEKLLTGGRPD
jgi:long-chain acyl-CoA synthetase